MSPRKGNPILFLPGKGNPVFLLPIEGPYFFFTRKGNPFALTRKGGPIPFYPAGGPNLFCCPEGESILFKNSHTPLWKKGSLKKAEPWKGQYSLICSKKSESEKSLTCERSRRELNFQDAYYFVHARGRDFSNIGRLDTKWWFRDPHFKPYCVLLKLAVGLGKIWREEMKLVTTSPLTHFSSSSST